MGVERAAFRAELAAAAPDPGIVASPGWEKGIPIGRDGRLKPKLSLPRDGASGLPAARSAEAGGRIEAERDALAQGLRALPDGASGEAKAGRRFRKDGSASVSSRSRWPEMIRGLRAQHATFTRAVGTIEAP